MGIVLERLKFAKLNLEHIGIIMIGDPAQLLPIGGEPYWSIKLTRMDSKPFHEHSIFGIHEMRQTFRMKRLENIPKYNEYRKYEKQRKTNEAERRAIAEFTLAAMEGDYDAVYLTDVRRTIDGDAESDNFVKNLIPRCRYGRTTEQDLLEIKQAFASEAEFAADEKFNEARVAEGYHFFANDEPNRKTAGSYTPLTLQTSELE